MNETFPTLFSPIKIGTLDLRNRLIMALYPTKYATDSMVSDRMIEFFRARARGGVSLIVLDACCLDYPAVYKGPVELRMDTKEHEAGLKSLINAVQAEGAKAFMQLNYPAAIPVDAGTKGAKEKKGRWMLPLVKGADAGRLKHVIECVGAGALKAKKIGYDGVEIQAGWGDLVAQFLSPLTNKREDIYGGILENRSRLLLEIIGEVRKTTGAEFPVQVKLVADEISRGGFSLNEAKITAKKLETAGVDSILVTVGNKKTKRYAIPPHSLPYGFSVSYAAAIKSAVDIPVIAMGKINTPVLDEEILKAGDADMISMTRALIADPDLPDKAGRGRTDDIRGCIYCLDDCADKGVPDLGRACANNPLAGLEYEITLAPVSKASRVWVIGGGPAGMQAALTAARRGHAVRLFEKTATLGGQFRLASLMPFKDEVKEVLRWLEAQITKSSIKVELKHPVSAEEVVAAKPDMVILAVGSKPRVPPLPGIDTGHVYSAQQYVEAPVESVKDVVVIGAGELGCEVAELAADKGGRVVVLEALDEAMPKAKSVPKEDLLNRLRNKQVRIVTGVAVGAIKPDAVVVTDKTGGLTRFPADAVVYATGGILERGLYHDLQGKIDKIFLVGDAEEPGNIGHALRTALRVAASI